MYDRIEEKEEISLILFHGYVLCLHSTRKNDNTMKSVRRID